MRRTCCLAILTVCGPLLGLVGTTLLGGCGTSPRVTVVHVAPGTAGDSIVGDPVKIKRRGQEGYVGLHSGFHVVRGPEDWRTAWSTGSEPPFPSEVDASRSMLLLAAAEKKDSVAIHVDKVVETGNLMVVWVRETRAGKGCVARLDRPPVDGVIVPRIDKPVRFLVSEERAESCGDPPHVTVRCRVNDASGWSATLAAEPGVRVECSMNAESRGSFALTDQGLTLVRVPAGSTSKLAYSAGPIRGAFPIDAFGTYSVHAEATDDSGRKSSAAATVTALPPKSRDVVVQLAWTNFDASDDPETFPRVKLRATETGTHLKARKECSVDVPRHEMCEVRTHSAYTHMVLKASDKPRSLDVTYVDERIEQGPRVCVQLFFDGARTSEVCDTQHRDANDRWSIGAVDMATGSLVESTRADAGAGGGDAR